MCDFCARKRNVITTKFPVTPKRMKDLHNFPKHISYHHGVIKAIATCGLIFSAALILMVSVGAVNQTGCTAYI